MKAGAPERAGETAERALVMFREMGMDWWAARAEGMAGPNS